MFWTIFYYLVVVEKIIEHNSGFKVLKELIIIPLWTTTKSSSNYSFVCSSALLRLNWFCLHAVWYLRNNLHHCLDSKYQLEYCVSCFKRLLSRVCDRITWFPILVLHIYLKTWLISTWSSMCTYIDHWTEEYDAWPLPPCTICNFFSNPHSGSGYEPA
jgi:hypothetical protein